MNDANIEKEFDLFVQPLIDSYDVLSVTDAYIGYKAGYTAGAKAEQDKIKTLESKLKLAVDALKYYADDKIYDPRPSRGYDCAGCEVCGGSGSFRAQEALNKIGEIK